MSLKIKVEDRISTYPGRVIMNPVPGAENTYDMVRADLPINSGTPINKVLFDSKADRVTKDVTLYVDFMFGNDESGTGENDSPFYSIQKAIDSIPKNLDGHTVTIMLTAHPFGERIVCRGFTGGKLIIGDSSFNSGVQGIEIDACTSVEVRVNNIMYGEKSVAPALLDVKNGSTVFVPYDMYLGGNGQNISGVQASHGSTICFGYGHTVNASSFNSAAIVSTYGGSVVLSTVSGNSNTLGLVATMGGTITYKDSTLNSDFGNNYESGGRIHS